MGSAKEEMKFYFLFYRVTPGHFFGTAFCQPVRPHLLSTCCMPGAVLSVRMHK